MLFNLFYLGCYVADGVCIQSVEHPGCVWDAKFLENGDVVTACSDGVVRIWTVQLDRIASSVELESYFSRLSQFKISRCAHFLITCFSHNVFELACGS